MRGLRNRGRQGEALAELSLLALSDIDFSMLLRAAVETVAGGLAADFASVLELEAEGRLLRLRVGHGWSGVAEGATSELESSSPAARALQAGGPVLVRYGRDAAAPSAGSVLALHRVASSAAMVIRGKERPFGVLAVHSRRRHAFRAADLSFLRSVGNVLAAAHARRELERELRHLAALVESSREAIVGRTLEGMVTSWNPAAERLFGYSAAEIVGRSITTLLSPAFEGEPDPAGQRLAQEESVDGLETVCVRKDATTIVVEWILSPVRDNAGRVVAAAAIARDVTERKRVDAALRESEARMRAVIDLALDALITIDDEGAIVEFNPAAEEMFGHPRATVIGRRMAELIVPVSMRAAHYRGFERFLASGEGPILGRRLELTALRADGSEFPVELAIAAAELGGRPVFSGYLRDISERKRIERELQHFAAIVASSEDAIIGKTLQGIVTSWNAGAERIYGYQAVEMIGRSIDLLVPVEQPNELPQILAKVRSGEAIEHMETVRLRKDGTRVDVSLTISPIKDSEGMVVGASTIARDISQRVHLEEQLRQSQRLESIGRLAGGIAHDFNNLLTVVNGYAEALLEEDDLAGRQELREIAGAAERATILTRQLLAFSRRQVLQPRIIDLNDGVRAITPMLARLIGEDITLVATLAPNLNPVLADPSQIEQVLVNLAVNARDAMPTGGRLTIETANVDLDEGYVALHEEAGVGPHTMLAVTDTGIGIDAETIKHVFEPFFTTKPVGLGTGLGLSTVYGIVKQSGGNIWIYSEPKQGTTLKLYFPAAQTPATPDDLQAQTRPTQLTGTETILVAEDDPPLRELVVRMLEKQGYRVLVAESPEEALRLTESQPRIDLLLSDLVMPTMSGKELANRVKERIPTSHVLFMSGYDDGAIARHGAVQAGAGFLEKPFSAESLARAVRDLLDRPR